MIAAVFAASALLDGMGVSLALGAFLMGVALSGSIFVEQVKAAVAPAKGLLLGLFFITVGMAIEWREVAAFGPRFVLVLVGLLALKFGIVLGLARVFRPGSASGGAHRSAAHALRRGGLRHLCQCPRTTA